MPIFYVTFQEKNYMTGEMEESVIPIIGETEEKVRLRWYMKYGVPKFSSKKIVDIKKAKLPGTKLEQQRIYDYAVMGKCIECGKSVKRVELK